MMTKEEMGPWRARTGGRRLGYGANALDSWDLIFLTVKGDKKVYFATSGGEGNNVIGENCFEK
jgi:hypothetical protein